MLSKDTVLTRIRALAAKTEANGCTEAEARAAAEMVDRLLEQYEINLDEIAIQNDQAVDLIELEGLGKHAVRYAGQGIANFTDSKVWTKDSTDLVFLGLEVDVAIAEYLTLLFMRAIDRESANFQVFNADYALAHRSARGDILFSFQIGMATRLSERLIGLKSKRDFTVRGGGTDLVVLKEPIVAKAFGTLGIHLHAGRSGRSVRDGAAFNAGRDAAERVSIGQGIGGRAGADAGRLR
jgi:hypothetical protein